MSDDTTEPADEIDRAPPIAFFLSAGSFLQTAILTHEAIEAKTLRLRFEMPAYYLYSHAIELTLKAFLRARGLTALELGRRPWSHDLRNLWAGCFERGFTLDLHARSNTCAVVEALAPYAATYEFRYVQIGAKTLPTLGVVREAAETLHATIKPIAVATVAGPITDRG